MRGYERGYNKPQFAAHQIAKWMEELAEANMEAVHQQASPGRIGGCKERPMGDEGGRSISSTIITKVCNGSIREASISGRQHGTSYQSC